MNLSRLYAGAVSGGIYMLSLAAAFAAGNTIESDSKLPPVTQLLQQGYEVKTGFIDASGVAFLVMQKATTAYLCHSGTIPACDKLN